MQSLPSNVIPFLVGFPVFFLFGWRALANYRRIHNPLSVYFALCGFLASALFFFSSVPLLFSQDQVFMQVAYIISDAALYAMLFVQAAFVYYLILRGKISRKLVLTPVLIFALAGFVANTYGYLKNGIAIVDNNIEYTLPLFSSVAQVMLLSNALLVGVLLISRLKEQSGARNKSTLVAIACLYILSAIAGALNVIFSGKPNDSPIIIASYMAGFGLFVIVMVAVHIKATNK